MTFKLTSIADWTSVISPLLKLAKDRPILCIEGDLGAGKTTFTKALMEHMGSIDIVQSPTFSLINVYQYPFQGRYRSLYHIDLYRLQSIDDALEIGIEEIIDSGDLCIIEWPQVIYPILNDQIIRMHIGVTDNGHRMVTID